MITDLIEVDPQAPHSEAVSRAAEVIRRGGVVAMPTDTLYCLVADPYNLNAVAMVYRAKGRDVNRALPLLVSGLVMAEELARDLPALFYILARRFWPGPLTLIVPASGKVPLKVTGNAGRVALRQSCSKLAAALLAELHQPLISTSANISGQPTCRTGIEVFGTMDGKVNLVLDGGFCSGSGATTVDLTEEPWRLIREGSIPATVITEILTRYRNLSGPENHIF